MNCRSSFGVLLDEYLKFAAGEEFRPIKKNTDPEFDILLSGSLVKKPKCTESLLEARELRNRLAGQPSGVVPGNLLQCVLTLDYQVGDLGGRQDEATDDNGKRQFERA